MQNFRLTNWLLLGYLALLLNFGPSAHHADFFGLHDRVSPVAASVSGQVVACGCCNHQLPSDSSRPTKISADLPLQTGDCLFCQYFEDFNAVVAGYDFDLAPAAVCALPAERIAEHVYFQIASSARGPPRLSHR
jgi:hypothetical protein